MERSPKDAAIIPPDIASATPIIGRRKVVKETDSSNDSLLFVGQHLVIGHPDFMLKT